MPVSSTSVLGTRNGGKYELTAVSMDQSTAAYKTLSCSWALPSFARCVGKARLPFQLQSYSRAVAKHLYLLESRADRYVSECTSRRLASLEACSCTSMAADGFCSMRTGGSSSLAEPNIYAHPPKPGRAAQVHRRLCSGDGRLGGVPSGPCESHSRILLLATRQPDERQENPYPAGPEDCHDVAEWLIDHAESKFGAELCYIGGESAGAHLSVNTCFHLIKTRPAFQFKGLVLLYGVYDLAQHLPQVYHFDKPLILQRVDMDHFIEAFCPGMDIEKRRDPAISPFYANLYDLAGKTPSGKLPPAFFAVGTWDCLLDDTMFFANKWLMSGSEAVVKVYPGAPHGFSTFPPASLEACQEMREHLIEFMSQ